MSTRSIANKLPSRLRQIFSSLEIVVALIASLSILLHLALRYLWPTPGNVFPLFLTLVIGGVPILFELIRKLLRNELGTVVLAGVAIVTSVLLGEYCSPDRFLSNSARLKLNESIVISLPSFVGWGI